MEQVDMAAEFMQKAALVSSFVYEVKALQEALETAVSICKAKKNNTTRVSDFISEKKETGSSLISFGTHKTVGAPGLNGDALKAIKDLCVDHHITLVTGTLRKLWPGHRHGAYLCRLRHCRYRYPGDKFRFRRKTACHHAK